MTTPIERRLELAFAPVHKRAFGTAIGLAFAMLILLVTLANALLMPDQTYPLVLLGEYFPGYAVSPQGAVIGAAWGAFVGFVAGWFLAFARNFVIAAWIFIARTRAELAATRDFLDHI
jgi:hypothetical protein